MMLARKYADLSQMIGTVEADLEKGELCYLGFRTTSGIYKIVEGKFEESFPEDDPAWGLFKEENLSPLKPARVIITYTEARQKFIRRLIENEAIDRDRYSTLT